MINNMKIIETYEVLVRNAPVILSRSSKCASEPGFWNPLVYINTFQPHFTGKNTTASKFWVSEWCFKDQLSYRDAP